MGVLITTILILFLGSKKGLDLIFGNPRTTAAFSRKGARLPHGLYESMNGFRSSMSPGKAGTLQNFAAAHPLPGIQGLWPARSGGLVFQNQSFR